MADPGACLQACAAALLRNRSLAFPAEVLPDTLAFVGTGLWLAFHVHTSVTWIEHSLARNPPSS